MADYLTAPLVGEMLNAPAVPPRRVPERDLLDYYLGPTGIPDRLRAANEVLNPIVAISDAGQDLRRGDYLGALTNTAAAAVPIAGGRMAMKAARGVPSLAPREYDEAASALTETLTGVSAPKPSDVTDMTRRQFMTGVAAAGGTAAMGPELLKKAAPDIARQIGPWESLVSRAKNILDNPVPGPFSEAAVDIPYDELMRREALRDIELENLQDDVFFEALDDPEGFADTILRKTDPEDTLEKVGLNRRMNKVFSKSGLDYNNLVTGALREYPEEVAERANVSVDDVVRYFEEMDEDTQDYLAMKGYDRLVDLDPGLAQKLDQIAAGVARDKLFDGGIEEVQKLVGDVPVQSTSMDSAEFELWKVLERKRRQKTEDAIDTALDFGVIDEEMANDWKKHLGEIDSNDIADFVFSS